MVHHAPVHATLNDWITHEAIPISLDSSESVHTAIDKMIISLGDSLELLGIGEALHSGEEILILRNQLFERLVTKYGYSAIAIESSFPRSRAVNEYVAGHGPASYEELQETGFGQGFGRLEANHDLIEWMRHYNADSSHHVKLHFYGFDMPAEATGPASPRQTLTFVLDYLASIDAAGGEERYQRLDPLLNKDAEWENPAALADPTKAIGLSPKATSLRIETEDLITELQMRGPELIARSNRSQYAEALHYAKVARQLLNFHAAIARQAAPAQILGIRDASMADNLSFIVEREQGKVLSFAHNRHLQRGKAEWVMGTEVYTWWPAGSHLDHLFGSRYAVIGTGLGISETNGITQPEADSLEARLTNLRNPAVLIPTHQEQGLPAAEIAALPTRSGSIKNPTYFALDSGSFTNFDYLAIFDTMNYARGGWSLEARKT